MRRNPRRLHRQRAHLDLKLDALRPSLDRATMPRGGWLRSIRDSLGMSAEQLGQRLGISKQAVLKLESNEVRKSLSIGSLERLAHALGCRLAYALIPNESLEAQLDRRARLVARRSLTRVGHSMALEAQRPPESLHDLQVTELANELKDRLSTELWDDK